MAAGGREQAIRAVFRLQAEACQGLGSPFTARICRLAAERLTAATAPGATVLGWQGDPTTGGDSVPLRLCGALNHLVVTARDADLAAVYPPNGAPDDDDELWTQVACALDRHGEAVCKSLESAPQTNEVRRSAVLLPAWCCLADHFGLPLAVSEVGASAGLNLFAERFLLRTAQFSRGDPDSAVVLEPDWRGEVPPQARPRIVARRGCDLAPIDPAAPQDRLRLLSYVWPDQRDRVARTEAAIAVLAREAGGAVVDRADAADWLDQRLATPVDGAVHVVQHTIAWQYFPEPVKARALALLQAAGARATADRPLARLSFEADGNAPGAAIALTLWPGGRIFSLGRADYHGRWVDWTNPAI